MARASKAYLPLSECDFPYEHCNSDRLWSRFPRYPSLLYFAESRDQWRAARHDIRNIDNAAHLGETHCDGSKAAAEKELVRIDVSESLLAVMFPFEFRGWNPARGFRASGM